MPFDCLIWAEEVQNNGYAGIVGAGPSGIGYGITGDTIVLKDRPGAQAFLHEFGQTGDTKPQGCRLDFTNTNHGQKVYGPGNVKYWPLGCTSMRGAPLKLQNNDTITGYDSSTNVSEGHVVHALVTYGHVPQWDLSQFAGFPIFRELMTITSSAAVTYNSGSSSIYSAATNTTSWFDTEGTYVLLGLGSSISAATLGGVCTVGNLGGDFQGFAPGGPVTPLSAVDFGVTSDYWFLEPIGPISGDAMKNTVTLGMCASTAGAITFPLIFARIG